MNVNKILVVDDNHDLAECLGIVLREEGYNVTVVYNGEDAVAKAHDEDFNLAIIDVKLPGINGVEVFRTIREEHPDTQGIMMTGYRVDPLLAEAMNNGATCVLHKPFPMELLFDQLNGLQQEAA